MRKKLTINHVIPKELDDAYRELGADTRREAEGLAWSEEIIEDFTLNYGEQ